MGSFLKKALSILSFSMLPAAALQASSDDSNYPKVEPCYGFAYNPGVFSTDCSGWYVDAAVICWKSNQEGISAGTLNTLAQGTNGANSIASGDLDFIGTTESQQVYPRFEWDAGFKLGIGYQLPCDSWSVGLEYTYYQTNTHNSYASDFVADFTDSANAPGIQGTLFSPAYSAFFDSTTVFDDAQNFVKLDWKVQFNQLDLDFGREFYVGRTMALRPHVGLRSLFIDQNYNIATSASGFDVLREAFSQTRESIKMSNDFQGIGIQGGLGLSFEIGWSLGVYGEIGGGATFGRARVTQRVNATNQYGVTALDVNQINYTVKDHYDTLLCNADFALGLQWREKINCDENLLTLKLGYEEHIFFGYNRFRNLLGPGLQDVITNSPTGNLSFYGIVFAAAIDF